MNKAVKARERAGRLMLAGLCTQCGRRKLWRARRCRGCWKAHRALVDGRRKKLKAEGLCVVCGKRKARGNLCRKCSQVQLANEGIRKKRYQAAGMCIACGQPRGSDGTRWYCRQHADRIQVYALRRMAELRAQGLCPLCGKQAARGRVMCRQHLDLANQRARKSTDQALAKGLCQQCRQPRGKDGTTRYCKPCAHAHSLREIARQKRRLAQGICIRCGKPQPPHRKGKYSCLKCNQNYYARKLAK